MTTIRLPPVGEKRKHVFDQREAQICDVLSRLHRENKFNTLVDKLGTRVCRAVAVIAMCIFMAYVVNVVLTNEIIRSNTWLMVIYIVIAGISLVYSVKSMWK